MTFDLYVPTTGWLQRLDPRTKLLLLGVGTTLIISAPGPLLLGIWLLLLHLVLRSSGVPWSRMGWVAQQLRFLFVVILLLFPWFVAEGQLLLALGPLRLTSGGLLAALTTALRLWAMSLLTLALLMTTTQRELVRGLVALGVPWSWGFTLSVALRQIPSLLRHVQQIQEAQAARGWDAERGAWLHRLRAVQPVLIALAIHVFRTVDTLTLAMTARGVGRSGPRTVRQPLQFTWRDALAAALAVAVLGVALLWRWRGSA
ncbi:MAG: energy-coupling factor transporter transmembrane protein EcfT [Anaerolineales bacterium]|nr:energy-coupling factor transporter transmembrane protein EcfT [Anaerolineales bacterium]MCB9128652.1 energy-coupling factor transporter transmembrane protein EcfT [Ardenticatenales bacterium]MCB9172884.1 energy-coupling factor transporter transmembrane protein EcfT [Ardenticatenales bacterium]